MATPASTKDNGPSKAKEKEEVEKKPSGNGQEPPAQESRSTALAAYIDNVTNLLYELQNEIEGMDDVKKLVSELLPQLQKEIVDKDNVKKLLSELQSKLQKEINRIDNAKKLLPKLQKAIKTLSAQLEEMPPHQPLLLGEEALHPILEKFEVSYDKLDYKLRICRLYLSILPENEVIKKRPIIYWWIANGLIKPTDGKTAEEKGEDLFEELLQFGLIMPCDNGKIPIVNKCRIHPWIRQMMIKFARKANLFDFDSRGMLGDKIAISGHACLRKREDNSKEENSTEDQIPNSAGRQLKTIFNVGEQYLFSDFPTGIGDSKKLVALQLGRFQESPRHHIQIERNDVLTKALSTLKLLKYLSLRGISRIKVLPSSVFQLSNLEILDLKGCYNLETLPNDISALKKLTHFDVSDCYLLQGMPKGLGKLTSIQTLKGFIIAESRKTLSRIGDLKSLEKLKRFSIHIGSEAEFEGKEFEKLEELKALQRLKISWGVVSDERKENVMKEDFKFPPSLEKLVLEGLPDEKLPKWLKPTKLRSLKKLYIKGGKFDDLNHGDSSGYEWKVEILRLWYMKITEIDLSMAEKWFPDLKYEAEIKYTNDARSKRFKNVKNVKQSEEERS